MSLKKFLMILMVLALSFGMFGCGQNTAGQDGDQKTNQEANTPSEKITISAAASLTEALTEIQKYYEKEAGTKLTMNFGSSGSLQKQIEEGAPTDVFLSASKEKMDKLEEKGLIDTDTRSNFVNNEIVLIVAEEYKDKIQKLSDLVDMDVKVAIGEPESVPAGKYAKKTMEHYQLWDKLADKIVFGKDVKQVAQYVESGEAAAGIVFTSDATTLKKSFAKEQFTEEAHGPIVYPMAVVKNSENKEAAKKFIDHLKTEKAKKIFEKYGFKPVY